MNKWIIYTKNGCIYCEKAKDLLKSNNIPFNNFEINNINKETIYKKIDKYTNNYRFFPIIFKNKKFIGGFNELEKYIKKKSCKKDYIFNYKTERCIKKNSKTANYLKKSQKINHKIPLPLIYKKDNKYVGSPYNSLMFMIYLKRKYPKYSILIPLNIKDKISNKISHEQISLRWNEEKKLITYPTLFFKYLKKYIGENKKYIVFPFGFTCISSGHANYMIYDNHNKTLERFEPYGNTYDQCIYKNIDHEIKLFFKKHMGNNFISEYKQPLSIDNYEGFQKFQANEENNKYDLIVKNGYNDKFTNGFDSFCTVWCIWYIELRLLNPNIDRKQILYDTIFKLDVENITFTNFIYDYAQYLIDSIQDLKNYLFIY